MAQRSWGSNSTEWFSFIILIIGLIIAGLVIILLAKFQRGMIGVVLAIAATFLTIYWLREVRRTMGGSFGLSSTQQKKELMLDVITDSEGITVISEIPGPKNKVKVKLNGQVLNITGGMNFKKNLDLDADTEIDNVTYVNGVLTVKLKRLD